MKENIQRFLSSRAFGVVGASSRRNKFGNKVLRCYLQAGKIAYPVNPHETEIEGLPVLKDISELPDDVKSISIITPPQITEAITEKAISKNIENIWMQPGAESEKAIIACHQHGINVIAGGPCILIELHFRED